MIKLSEILKESDEDKKYDNHTIVFITAKSAWHDPVGLAKNSFLHTAAYQKNLITTNYKFVKQEEKNGKLYIQFSIQSPKKYSKEDLQNYFNSNKSSTDRIVVY